MLVRTDNVTLAHDPFDVFGVDSHPRSHSSTVTRGDQGPGKVVRVSGLMGLV
jgi:hypothetical protein